MCGIAGIVHPARPAEALSADISDILANIGHRGPDGAGYLVDDGFAMGTVRLAILDPAGGAQPFGDDTGRYWLCYNGEIYNYRELRETLRALGCTFRTHCDTEVVLNAWIIWGPDCLRRFNGGFAFALYDSWTKDLVLARDRFGKRPLFYARHGKALLFASEMKAFLAIPGFAFEQDPAQLSSILGQTTPLPDQSGFIGIESLPMGQWLSLRNGSVTARTYAELRFDAGPAVASEAEAVELIRTRLARSVELRLRSDVEVGVYLSGGVDSAIVAALAGDFSTRKLSTFSVEFEDSEFDESADQRLVAAHLGTRHHAERISHADIAHALPDAVFHAEMPAFRSAFVPMFILSQRTRDEGIKVILSGEGADEAFLGYDLFKETLLRAAWSDMAEDVRRERLQSLYPHLGHYGPEDIAALTGLYQQFSREHMPGLFSHELRFQNGLFSTRLLKHAGSPFAAITALTRNCSAYSAMSATERAQWLEYQTLLPGYLLSTQGERMSLAHGVENRCPFLDPDIVALASSLNLKFDDGFREKRLLREAFRDRLPDRIVDKPKFPYRAPDGAAFAAVRPDYLDLVLSPEELGKIPFLDSRFAQRLATKVLTKPACEISTKENQTFLFLLSISLLHRAFVSREGRRQGVLPPLEKIVDLTREKLAHASQGSFSSVT
ncbi:asparagine synthase (glutamine-hydrolyzing) [Aurantimonas aggregata]|uniref:asparagine synthase (glutamine-hydrolyzing) n=1 Tax=Aurantimonas aggregata TaxID=2047720 RepID=A0A6L9MC32_9HYPH|nr:asparagine synthase (glutamine-hydrolyzing) [Aurantimonas aggregata]NDV85379.1 asparagine synthase (glutamine-hydrolyzing) [Aurantimonas aggregata]